MDVRVVPIEHAYVHAALETFFTTLQVTPDDLTVLPCVEDMFPYRYREFGRYANGEQYLEDPVRQLELLFVSVNNVRNLLKLEKLSEVREQHAAVLREELQQAEQDIQSLASEGQKNAVLLPESQRCHIQMRALRILVLILYRGWTMERTKKQLQLRTPLLQIIQGEKGSVSDCRAMEIAQTLRCDQQFCLATTPAFYRELVVACGGTAPIQRMKRYPEREREVIRGLLEKFKFEGFDSFLDEWV